MDGGDTPRDMGPFATLGDALALPQTVGRLRPPARTGLREKVPPRIGGVGPQTFLVTRQDTFTVPSALDASVRPVPRPRGRRRPMVGPVRDPPQLPGLSPSMDTTVRARPPLGGRVRGHAPVAVSRPSRHSRPRGRPSRRVVPYTPSREVAAWRPVPDTGVEAS